MKKAFWLVFILFAALNFSCARHSPEAFYFGNYSEAEGFYQKGDYERAIQKYQAYIDENPEGNLAIIASYYIAKSYAALGQTDEAAARYQALIKDHPDVVWANFAETQVKELEFGKKAEPKA